MTHEEYQQLPEFTSLPLYDDDDGSAESITRIDDPNYTGVVHEAIDTTTAHEYASRPTFEPKGAIRYRADDETPFIYVYFWERR